MYIIDIRVRYSSHGLKRMQQHQLDFLEWKLNIDLERKLKGLSVFYTPSE